MGKSLPESVLIRVFKLIIKFLVNIELRKY